MEVGRAYGERARRDPKGPAATVSRAQTPAGHILQLQRTVGNAAVARAISTRRPARDQLARTRIEVSGEEVPGTASEDLDVFQAAVDRMNGEQLDAVGAALAALPELTDFDAQAIGRVNEATHPSADQGPSDPPAAATPLYERPTPGYSIEQQPESHVSALLVHLPYEAVHQLGRTSRRLLDLVSREVRGRSLVLAGPPPVGEAVALGMIRVLAHDAPTRTLADDPLRETPVRFPPRLDDLALEVARLVGWRQYTSALRPRDPQTLSLRGYGDLVLAHTHATDLLRRGATYPRFWRDPPVVDDDERAVRAHWKDLQSRAGHGPPRDEDRDAKRLFEKLKLDETIDNLSVEYEPRADANNNNDVDRIVYSNRELNRQQIELIEKEGFKVRFARPEDRRGWGPPQGKQRGLHPTQFHSEMQARALTGRRPWRFGYVGNVLEECLMCFAQHHAFGWPSARGPGDTVGKFTGCHGRKPVSLVVEEIRTTSALLQHLLGPGVASMRELLECASALGSVEAELVAVRDEVCELAMQPPGGDHEERMAQLIARWRLLEDACDLLYLPCSLLVRDLMDLIHRLEHRKG